MRKFDEAQTNLQQSLVIEQNKTPNAGKDLGISSTLKRIGLCQMKLKSYDEALTNLQKSLEIYQNVLLSDDRDHETAKLLDWIGRCQFILKQYDKALTSFNLAFALKKKLFRIGYIEEMKTT